MKQISLGQSYTNPIVLCLGFFDCMHLGHVQLLTRARQLAGSDAQVALFTFSNNHFETLKRPTKLIYTFDERTLIYQTLGVDVLISAQFDSQFMALSGQQFLQKISAYNLKAVVCGEDFTCGSDLLSASLVGPNLGVKTEVVRLVKQDGQKVCSTLVRQLLAEHKIAQANALLQIPYFFGGVVQSGRHVGHNLGYPTVNLSIPADKLAIEGVYAGAVSCQGNTYPALINVGAAPTFGVSEAKVEAHLLGFDGDLYGKYLQIFPQRYLRPVHKFANAAELSAQLQKDISEVQRHD